MGREGCVGLGGGMSVVFPSFIRRARNEILGPGGDMVFWVFRCSRWSVGFDLGFEMRCRS